ncbi:MAG: DNA-processing protein DprA [Bdellovibrionales bacterium]|nr:DNA-processing protein DprA [Bdellovibrionales bacterium]
MSIVPKIKHLRTSELPLLIHLHHPPEPLYALGNTPLPDALCVGVVGSRRASQKSLGVAAYLARELARAGVWVVSGLAYGVDSAAHRGALAAKGKTLAVLAHGLDRVYPAAHRELARSILHKNGGLLSQYASGVPPRKSHFPERNRTLAGLCQAVVVVEAAAKSGSLITARFALEEGREVFVVPGFFSAEAFSGSHSWIQQGARLLHSVEELFSEWGLSPNAPLPGSGLGRFCKRFERYVLSDFYKIESGLLALRNALSSGECLSFGPHEFLYLGT